MKESQIKLSQFNPFTPPSLKLVQERKIHKLLKGHDKNDSFEASGVVIKGKHFYVVFDNLSQIAKLDPNLPKNSKKNQLVGEKNAETGFESISYNPLQKRFYVLTEALKHKGHYNAKVQSYGPDFDRLESQWLDYNFQSLNKGFEGLAYVSYQKKDFLLALCEGNDCEAGEISQVPGGGRIKVFQRTTKKWKYVASIRLPSSVEFIDYAGMSLKDSRLAVVSQASAQMWVGTLDFETWQISEAGKIYEFPRDAEGKEIYCNVEGVAWLNDKQVVTVTDRRKKGKQAKRCDQKDQSIQIFELPSLC